MPSREQRPRARQSDRVVQIRKLLNDGSSKEELIRMGFAAGDVEKAVRSMEKKSETFRNDYEKKLRNPARCKACGGIGEKDTFDHRFRCRVCVERERINRERGGWRRV
jgi:predicted Zn-ribbon and HTH transcriptional regulator